MNNLKLETICRNFKIRVQLPVFAMFQILARSCQLLEINNFIGRGRFCLQSFRAEIVQY